MRVGVVSTICDDDGNPKLLLPDGSFTRLDPTLTDDQIVAKYGLDTVRRARQVRWGQGGCIDGPREGAICYVADELGSRVVMGSRTGEEGDVYEVVANADDSGFAALRFVPRSDASS